MLEDYGGGGGGAIPSPMDISEFVYFTGDKYEGNNQVFWLSSFLCFL